MMVSISNLIGNGDEKLALKSIIKDNIVPINNVRYLTFGNFSELLNNNYDSIIIFLAAL